ncbi:Monodehydroascorbate reductase (NADH) [Bertholletia excelsa]
MESVLLSSITIINSMQNPPAELAGGNVHLITTTKGWEEHLSEANKGGKTVIANFSTSWSGPCREIAPAYVELANRYSSTTFLTVDIDALPEFSSSWDIKATPTFFFLKDGRQVDKLVGSNKEKLWKKVGAIADSYHAK